MKEEFMWLILNSNEVSLLMNKEYAKWACVCKTWSNAHDIWVNNKYRIALEEARFFADFEIECFHQKKDTNSIVCGLTKNMWHHVSVISCLRKIQIFLSKKKEIDSDDVIVDSDDDVFVDSDDDDGSLLIDDIGDDANDSDDVFVSNYDIDSNQNHDYHESMNDISAAVKSIEDHDLHNRIHYEYNLIASAENSIESKYEKNSMMSQSSGTLQYQDRKKISAYMLRKEEQESIRNVLSLSLLEKLEFRKYIIDYMTIEQSYNAFIVCLRHDCKSEKIQKIEDFFERYIFDEIILSINHGPKNVAFIDEMSRTELVNICVFVVKTFGKKSENATICSFAVRVLKKMFSNQICRTQISSANILCGLILMANTCTRKDDMISSLLLIMAICETNPLMRIEFLQYGGLELLTKISKNNSTVAISFMICNFIFKICNTNNHRKGFPVVESCVVNFFTDSVIQFIYSVPFIHSVCKTMLCLSSNIENRIQFKKNGCIQVLEQIKSRYNDNAFIHYSSSTIKARIQYTIV